MIRFAILPLLAPIALAGLWPSAAVGSGGGWQSAAAQRPVRCADYLDHIRVRAAGFHVGPDRGQYGPRHALPALAVYAESGDPRLADGIKRTLRHYGRWVDRKIAEEGGVFSMEGATLLAIHFRELRKRGDLTSEDESWLREMLLKLRRYQFAARPGDGLWRGSQHRAMAQGTNHLLAAAYAADEPQARRWQAYGARVWKDWWAFRDIGINDIAYFSSSLGTVLRTADLLGRTEVFTDPGVRAVLWDRLVHETSPDGALIPYGAHAGWNGLSGVRIWALELAARHSRDGRYRFAASRLMNYSRTHGFSPGQEAWQDLSIEAIALAALACDDSVLPVEPDSGSRLLMRPEIVRLAPAEASRRFPQAGGLDASMYMTARVMPHKLIFRSGWEPGDLFMMVEAHPRHDPLNPTAILALERWSASFAEMISEKYESRENAVHVEDLSGTSRFVGHPGPRPAQLPLGYDRMEADVEAFGDDPLTSHASLAVANYMGFKARQTREILFVKNRFVLVRDETVFDDRFRARLGPVWNTQEIGAERGPNWIDTRLSGHWYSGSLRLYGNPPANLLLFHAPRTDARLTVQTRSSSDEPAKSQASALRHFKIAQLGWEGEVEPGTRLQFVSLLLPHRASDAAALARSIRVLRDEPGLAAVAVDGERRWELALLNPSGRRVALPSPAGEIVTDARALFLSIENGRPSEYSARAASLLMLQDAVLLDAAAREDRIVERGGR